jgi:hypothetical protein
MIPFGGNMAEHAHRLARDFGADTIPGQYQNVEIHAVR